MTGRNSDETHGATAGPATADAKAKESSPQPRHVVGLIHGIRTYGRWMERVRDVMERESEGQIRAFPIKYGFFNVFKFLAPWAHWRKSAVDHVVKQIRQLQKRFPTSEISLVAHSFGAYCSCRTLIDQPNIQVRYLIICGAVAPPGYPWWLIHPHLSGDVQNHYSNRDGWPAVGAAASLRYDPIGTFGGPEAAGIRNVEHNRGHGDYFEDAVARKWTRFILTGEIYALEPSESKGRTWTSWPCTCLLASIGVLKWMAVLLPVFLASLWVAVIHYDDGLSGHWKARVKWRRPFDRELINHGGKGNVEPQNLQSDGILYLHRGDDKWQGLSKWELRTAESVVSRLCVELAARRDAVGGVTIDLATGFRKIDDAFVAAETHLSVLKDQSRVISYAPFYHYRMSLRFSAKTSLAGVMIVSRPGGQPEEVGDVECWR